VTKLKA